MKRQELFDRVVEHLYRQGKPSIADDGSCVYRTAASGKLADGCACGIGGIMPDALYHPKMEGRSARVSQIYRAVGARNDQSDFVASMQQDLHDRIAGRFSEERYVAVSDKDFMAALPAAVRDFAERKRLKVPAIVGE